MQHVRDQQIGGDEVHAEGLFQQFLGKRLVLHRLVDSVDHDVQPLESEGSFRREEFVGARRVDS